MRVRRKQKQGFPVLPVLFVIALVCFAGLWWYVVYGPPAGFQPTSKGGGEELNGEITKTEESKIEIDVPVPKGEDGKVVWESQPEEVEEGVDPVVSAVNAFLKLPNVSQIAPNAKCVVVKYVGGNAELHFENLFGRGYGTDNEKTLIDGIIKSVAKNSNVRTVTFYQNGKAVTALGNLEIEGPQPVR